MEIQLLQEYLAIAEGAAQAAGQLLVQGGQNLRFVDSDEAKDVKLRADREAEKLVRSLLAERTLLPIIGEELGGDPNLPLQNTPYWVVDPLDGTHNYLREVPVCCVSIGLLQGLQPLLGVIFDFNRNELFTGISEPSGNMQINGHTAKPNWAATLDQASLNTGFPVGKQFSKDNLSAFMAKISTFKKVRSVGSAALGLAWVAAGRFDAYYEESIRLWDVAGGLALVRAAGGVHSILPVAGKPLAYDVWAAGKSEFILP